MATNDYVINFSDPAKTPFIIKPFTTNGPLAPENPGLPTTSVAANTTLLLPGKGLFEYGEFTDENLVHMMEHFAGPTEPVFPIQGQLWFKNDTTELFVCIDPAAPLFSNRWKNVVISGFVSGDLDMNNYKIINLANATNPQDALNMQTGDGRYVNVTGDTMTGTLDMSSNRITNLATPISTSDATTKQYVDALFGGGPFLPLSGGTMTGTIDVGDGGSNTNRLFNFYSDPTDSTSAVSFSAGDTRYVQSAPVGTELMNGTYSINSGNLTLSAGNVLFGASVTIDVGANRLRNVTNPVNPQDAATKAYVDGLIGGTSNQVDFNRLVFVGDGVTTAFITAPFLFAPATNTLSVFVNGVKQIASQVAIQYLQIIGPPSLTAPTPLLPSTAYQFRLQVNGGPITNINITTPAGTTSYATLVNLINAAILSAYGTQVAYTSGQVALISSSLLISIASATVGSGSAINVLDGTGPVPLPLLAALASTTIPVGPVSISTNYAYAESGIPFAVGNSFTFGSPPGIGDIIEAIVATV